MFTSPSGFEPGSGAPAEPGPLDRDMDLDFYDDIDVDPTVGTGVLAALPTGAALAIQLDLTTGPYPPGALSDPDLVEVIHSAARLIAWAQAQQATAIAEHHRRAQAHPTRRDYVADELAADLHLTHRHPDPTHRRRGRPNHA